MGNDRKDNYIEVEFKGRKDACSIYYRHYASGKESFREDFVEGSVMNGLANIVDKSKAVLEGSDPLHFDLSKENKVGDPTHGRILDYLIEAHNAQVDLKTKRLKTERASSGASEQ